VWQLDYVFIPVHSYVSPENNVSPKNIRVGTILIIVSLLTMLPYSFLPAFGPLYLRPANRSISVLVHVSDLVRRLYHPSSQPFLLYKRSETEQLQVFFPQLTHNQHISNPLSHPTQYQLPYNPKTYPSPSLKMSLAEANRRYFEYINPHPHHKSVY